MGVRKSPYLLIIRYDMNLFFPVSSDSSVSHTSFPRMQPSKAVRVPSWAVHSILLPLIDGMEAIISSNIKPAQGNGN